MSMAPCFLQCLLGIWTLTSKFFVTLDSMQFKHTDDELSRCWWRSEGHWGVFVSWGRVPMTHRCPPSFSSLQWRAQLYGLPFSPSVSFSRTKNTQTYRHPPAHTVERFCLLLSPYSVHLPPPVGPAYSPPLASLTWISSLNIRRLSASTLSPLQALLHSTGKLMLQHADQVRSMSLMNSLQRLKMKLLSKDPDHTSPYDLSGLCPPLLSSPLLCIPAALVLQSFKVPCFLPSPRFARAVPLSGIFPTPNSPVSKSSGLYNLVVHLQCLTQGPAPRRHSLTSEWISTWMINEWMERSKFWGCHRDSIVYPMRCKCSTDSCPQSHRITTG